MLISHDYKFIYLKTRKTASTSIEGVLETLCASPDHQPKHLQAEIKSKHGYIAGRAGKETPTDFLQAHSPAMEVRRQVGRQTFRRYRKIYAVRNPYDKTVSWFWHVMPKDTVQRLKNDFGAARELFRDWLRMRPVLPADTQYYKVGGKVFEADRISYEHLHDDLVSFLRDINAPDQVIDMPEWKTAKRRHKDHSYIDYYDDDTRDVVKRTFSFDFNNFGYEM